MRFRNLATNFTAYIFGAKHDIDNLSYALETTRDLLHYLKPHEFWFINGLK